MHHLAIKLSSMMTIFGYETKKVLDDADEGCPDLGPKRPNQRAFYI